MNSLHLDPEELEILESVEQGEWQSVLNKESELQRHQLYAEATLKQDKQISIDISSRDWLALQRRAVRDGLPYQILASSILHKYLSGTL